MPFQQLAQSPLISGLTLFLGAAAVYVLLPRPRAFPRILGVLLGILALAAIGVLLTPATALVPETFLFYLFSAISLGAGTLLVTQRNPARAALSFALVVLSTCGLFLLLAAPFLMAATTIIYAGAIVVTFLFVLMLAQQEGFSSADARSREPLLSVFTAGLLLFALVLVINRGTGTARAEKLIADAREALDPSADKLEAVNSDGGLLMQFRDLAVANNWKDLAAGFDDLRSVWPGDAAELKTKKFTVLVDRTEHRLTDLGLLHPAAEMPLSPLSGTPPNTDPANRRALDPTNLPPVPAENSAWLGRSLFTDYLLPVELGGTLLLVATIGAIAIAHRRQPGSGREVAV
jgi:NADH-quinone oxidoreductase subunit J